MRTCFYLCSCRHSTLRNSPDIASRSPSLFFTFVTLLHSPSLFFTLRHPSLYRDFSSYWQGPIFPNSSSEVSAERHIGNLLQEGGLEELSTSEEGVGGAGEESRMADRAHGLRTPPRPYPRLEACYSGTNATLKSTQQWSAPPQLDGTNPSAPAAVCTAATSGSLQNSPCWNVQKSKKRLILWEHEVHKDNSLFGLRGSGPNATLWSALQDRAGCIGASGVGGELALNTLCAADAATNAGNAQVLRGWTWDASTGNIAVPGADGQMLCVTGDLNGTAPSPGPSPGPPPGPGPSPLPDNCRKGCLFNVAADPTEQNNLFAAQPERVANMTAALDKM